MGQVMEQTGQAVGSVTGAAGQQARYTASMAQVRLKHWVFVAQGWSS